MKRKWTREQQAAIDTHGVNLLVAAAAGSGKTAVLVERVIQMITRREHPTDLDRILIVTFTRAAASEMKERIQKAIEEQMASLTAGGTGDSPAALANLKRQAALLPHSFIMTIDSFCAYVVRNYCHTLDMDPDFRIGDQGELTLLQADVMEALLEERYQEGDEGFLRFVESYGGARDDQAMEKYISRLYHFAQSDPWPEEWLDRCEQELAAGKKGELDSLPWIRCVLGEVRRFGREARICLEQGLALCQEEDGPYLYEEMFLSDLEIVDRLLGAETYEEMYRIFEGLKFMRRPSKKDSGVSEEKKALAARLRDQGKKTIQDLKKQYFVQPPGELRETMGLLEEPVTALIGLTREFSLRYAQAKAEKNILDFNDLEHRALDILAARQGDGLVRQEAARELSSYFEEIMIDEYQDSSLLQEYILNSISREWEGQPNQFMVGDVKQSIYSFRMARPELFIRKYQAYGRLEEDGPEKRGLRIDLSANFRSRSQVLESVNRLFYQIMGPELGEISYDEKAALYPAASYPEPSAPEDVKSELILIDGQKEIYTDLTDEDYHIRELEAKTVARRIRELTDPEHGMEISDGAGGYRPARYSDIVILLRSMAGWGQMMRDQLEEAGIPAYMESSAGYFSALEVQTVLNLLRIIDNPRQDIPLAAVMASPAGGFTQEEMARIVGEGKRKKKKNPGLYENLKAWQGRQDPLGEKAGAFLERLGRYREAAVFMPVHQMVLYVLEDTGYGDFAASMPGGEGRKANLDMLVSYSIHFEQTSYHGLFQFIRYIEHLRRYEVDFGAASAFGEEDNIVRITTIHKSKGLEYPIVILAGAGKRFNLQDSREKILFHPVYGVAADLIDLKLRLKLPSLMKKVVQRQMVLEQLGEELRILYVAMTRAKEKLIITAADSHMESKRQKWDSLAGWEPRLLPVSVLSQASSFLDWLLMGLKRGDSMDMAVSEADVSQVIGQEILRQAGEQASRKELEELAAAPPEDQELYGRLEERLSFCYPGQAEMEIYSKLSVSELKESQEEDGFLLYEAPAGEMEEPGQGGPAGERTAVLEEALPGFMREEKLRTATALGTLYHRVAERIDFSIGGDLDGIRDFLSGMAAQGLLSAQERKRISPYKWRSLLSSPIGRRMGQAQQKGVLFRERPFIMGIPARLLRKEWDSGQLVTVQGIIDAWFIEDDGIVIVDYKTDRVAEGKNLIDRYGKQLYYYRAALEQAESLPVKECIIYSFHLEEEIPLPLT